MDKKSRGPAITAWAVRDDPDPDEWTVNIAASILEVYFLIGALGTASLAFAEAGNKDAAELSYYVAEDLNFHLQKVGGSAAALRMAARLKEEKP